MLVIIDELLPALGPIIFNQYYMLEEIAVSCLLLSVMNQLFSHSFSLNFRASINVVA